MKIRGWAKALLHSAKMPWRNGHPAWHQRYFARTICYAELRICASLATHRDILPLGIAPPSYNDTTYINNLGNHYVPPGLNIYSYTLHSYFTP